MLARSDFGEITDFGSVSLATILRAAYFHSIPSGNLPPFWMSDPRIIKISMQILETACDHWNQLLAYGPGKKADSTALSVLVCDVRNHLLDPSAVPTDNSPEAQGQHGLLAWLIWFSNKLALLELSPTDRSTLQSSISRAVSLLSSCSSIHQAVEASARRQVYELAYGLTHEINNPLGNIVARAQQLLSKATDPMDRKSLATVVDQGMRAHEMLAELMRAVQPREVELSRSNITLLAREAYQNARLSSKLKNLSWHFRDSSQEIWAQINRSGILEALRLIAQNAIDACKAGESILWTLEETDFDVKIAIEDSGPGLSSESVCRAFDLFYSGREAGRGLGVSLAVVRRIVSESRGEITLTSDQKLGCRVELKFPKSDAPQSASSPRRATGIWKI